MKTLVTEEIADIIRKNYHEMTGSDIARMVGINPDVVNRWMKRNGYKTPESIVKAKRIAWKIGTTRATDQDDSFIKENYLQLPQKQIAERLGFSETLVRYRMKKLGLEVPKEVALKNFRKSHFKKGSTPFNKGTRLLDYISEEGLAKLKSTWFKKGNIPATKNVGCVSIRIDHSKRGGKAYYYYCPEKGKTKPLHVMNWEAAHGAVPQGSCLWFKDGDTLNPSLENLELITRAENMRRNQLSDGTIAAKLSQMKGVAGVHIDYGLKNEIQSNHPELIDIKRKQLLLEREIKSVKK